MNYKLLIEYDGTRYNGWQKQGNTANTIQGKIEDVLERMQGQKIVVHGAGRTDAGVHAKSQAANVHMNTDKTPDEVREYLNKYLPEDIGILDVSIVPDRFHSRLNAKEKTYSYHLAVGGQKHVFQRKSITFLDGVLDVDKMRLAAAYLEGEHDFTSFCANKKMKKSAVRKLFGVTIRKYKDEIFIDFRGDGFLYNMARLMTGTLIEVGQGKRSPQEMLSILKGCDRSLAGPLAPARGLTLLEVVYPQS